MGQIWVKKNDIYLWDPIACKIVDNSAKNPCPKCHGYDVNKKTLVKQFQKSLEAVRNNAKMSPKPSKDF